jgi:hypothetical protein
VVRSVHDEFFAKPAENIPLCLRPTPAATTGAR